jgi:outer membrane immunogenic protein
MTLKAGLIAGALLLGLGVAPVMAADKGGAEFVDAFTPTADKPWTGCWGAANLGYGMQTSQYTTIADATLEEAAKDVSYGVGAGCDGQAGSFVFGAMADMDWTRAEGNVAGWDSQWAAAVRAGALLTPKTLLYGLVGYTKLDGGFSFGTGVNTFSRDMKGLTLGGGVEQMLSGGWAIKAEYRWVDLGDATAPDGVFDGLEDGTKVDNNLHQVRLGLVYRFGALK